MKINIDDIPEGGLSVDLSEDGKNIESLAGALDFKIIPPVNAHMDVTKTDGNVYIAGEINAKVLVNCSRCLKEFEHAVKSDIASFFTGKKEEGREKELKPADMDINYLEGREIDTDEMLLGQISLDVPVKPLCNQDCKGLCPRCGADMNLGECGCGKDDKTDPRFAMLKDFKVK